LQVDELRLEGREDGRELAGRVRFEREGLEPQRLWFRSPVEAEGEPDGSAFLPALVHLSMQLDEPLHIDGPVSKVLLDNAGRASLVLRSWWPDLADARVSAAETAEQNGGRATGVFFTRGVDSWHSVLETVAEQPGEVRLLGWTGGESSVMYEGSADRAAANRAESEAALREAATVAGARLDLMESNLPELVNPHVRWSYTHGGLLAAVALAHGGLAEARVGSTLPLGKLVPLGSHPLLDSLWSTEGTRIVHHAAETARTQKLVALSARPDVLATLRVCESSPPRRNCGTCDKCVRTMLGLELAGAPPVAPFDAPLSPRRVRRMAVSPSLNRHFGEETLDALNRARRHDLGDQLQIAFATDLARRAARRGYGVVRNRLLRRIDRVWSRAR
jgi:hypothetical protein